MINYTSQKITKVLGLIALTGLSGLVSAQTLNWVQAGPIYNAGRARNMIVDKTNSQILYVGSTSSGIFKSTDAGLNWAPVNDQATVRNISYLAQAADGAIYASTGEGFLRLGQKAKAQVGTGLYRLDQTVSPAVLVQVASASVVGTVINRIACNPNLSTHIALATNLGILVSTNGGASFNPASLPGVSTGTTISGQDVKFDSNGILYCSIGTEVGTSTVNISRVYKSSNASLTGAFTDITPFSSSVGDMNYGRIELAIAPSDNNVVYVSCSNKYVNPSSSTLKALYVSYDAAGTNSLNPTWGLILQGSAQLDPLSNGATRASGDYAHVITVSPSDPNFLFMAGYSFYVFQRTGGSNSNPIGFWAQAAQNLFPTNQNYLHENIHDIKIVPGSPQKYYFVTDAGVFRSIDLVSQNQVTPPSYQPFYKGLVTGQYNSVSIERYPITAPTSTVKGSSVAPYYGFIGGTGGNGMTYFSGTSAQASEEISYLNGEIYNAEYSKILNNAAITAEGTGILYRSANVKNSAPTAANVNEYTGVLSKVSPAPTRFNNSGVTTGTQFKLWESYGQLKDVNGNLTPSPDDAVFYNDTVPRYEASMSGVAELTTRTTFNFSTSRPNKYALIDSIVVRTGTVQLPISNATYKDLQTPFNGPGDRLTINLKLANNYSVNTTTTTVLSVTNTAGSISGPASVTLNPVSLIDNISLTFLTPPFGTKTITQYPNTTPPPTGTAIIVPDAAAYYKVFATIYYKYKAGDIVTVTDNNISTISNTYTTALSSNATWRYGSFPTYTIGSNVVPAVSNPTYVLIPSAPLNTVVTQTSSSVFTVAPYGTTTYTLQKYGTFSVSANPINYTMAALPIAYTLTAPNNTAITSPSFVLTPGNITLTTNVFVVTPVASTVYTITQLGSGTLTASSTFTLGGPTSYVLNPGVLTQTNSNVFALTPTVLTNYTITQTTGTLTQDTYSTVSTATYVLNPGNISQSTNNFTVNTGAPQVYTLSSLSSNTLSAANSTISYSFPAITTSVINFGAVPLCPNNKPVKIPAVLAARLAMIFTSNNVTNGSTAVVVAKNPLALNDPLNMVRVSQSGCYTDDVNGNPTFSTITIPGKPILLEWSKSGTELYYATGDNKLYRVSHITSIMDLSKSSYSGKFYTDIFKYGSNGPGTTLNPESPYRTTLVGQFDSPITSIAVSNDDKNVMLSFNPVSSASPTTGIVMYSTSADIRKTINPVTGWAKKDAGLSNIITYCSMMEKSDSKKVFLGTDNGMFYTNDITTGNWANVNTFTSTPNSNLPNVQVFDIKQQVLSPSDCYNSGQIYVATNGRGIWSTGSFFSPFLVGIDENEKFVSNGNNLSLFPNPTNGKVTVSFNSKEGENAVIQLMDISGRLVKSENIGKLNSGDVSYNFETNDLNSGVYIVNISSDSGVKRVAKLVVTK